jgi:ferrochelatase
MSPRQFLKQYRRDRRVEEGSLFPDAPLTVAPGEQVGVVLLASGGPTTPDEVAACGHAGYMDPVVHRWPLPVGVREVFCRWLAQQQAVRARPAYEVIGGSSPVQRLTREQARTLEAWLNDRLGKTHQVGFRVYPAMRYGHPSIAEVQTRMEADGIGQVVLLPMYPHYAAATTGSALLYWQAVQQHRPEATWPLSVVRAYGTHPKYVQALNERIDQTLQRFPKDVRAEVPLLFTTEGTLACTTRQGYGSYRAQVQQTIDQLLDLRGHDRSHFQALQSRFGWGRWFEPGTSEVLQSLAQAGHRSVLVVPMAFVSDHVETAWRLDMRVREEAEALGLTYEVMYNLNCHSLFIETLAELVLQRLHLPGVILPMPGGDGQAGAVQPLTPTPTCKTGT